MTPQQPMAADVLAQHATNAMLAHAADVAELRGLVAAHRAALEAAYAAIDALEAGADAVPSVPGYLEWREQKAKPA